MATITLPQFVTRLNAAVANLETAEASWSTLTGAQKDQAQLLAVRVCIACTYLFTDKITRP